MSDQSQQPTLPPSESDRQGFNRRWHADNEGLKIYRPTTDEEAFEAFQQIVEISPPGYEVQITCGRHCYEAFVYNRSTKYIIDMSGVRGYKITDADSGAFNVGVGFSIWDMYRTFNNTVQRTLPGGSCYSVGLGGHITGGGYGLLSRLYGLTVDYLSGVDIIIQSGPGTAEKIHCSATEHSDLFWGLKGGGGGQFGIITRYYFDNTPKAPETMYTTSIVWEWINDGALLTQDQFNSIVDCFQKNFCKQEEKYWNTWANIHLNHKDASNITITAFEYYLPELHGDKKTFEANLAKKIAGMRAEAGKIAPLSNNDYSLYGHPFIPSTKAMNAYSDHDKEPKITHRCYTYLEGTQNFNSSGLNQYGKYKSAYLRKNWTTTMLTAAYKGLTARVVSPVTGNSVDMTQSLIQIDSYGGKINTIDPADTVIYQRSSIMKLQFQTYWDPTLGGGDESGPEQIRWINHMFSEIYADTNGYPDPEQDSTNNVDGCYYNYPDIELGTDGPATQKCLQFALKLYFGPNLPRLTEVKQKYNSYDWFQSSQSVPVTGGSRFQADE